MIKAELYRVSWGRIAHAIAMLAFSTTVGACRVLGTSETDVVRVFVAASAAAAVQEAVDRSFALRNMNVSINAASSAVLARQIEAGAPADVFLTADSRWVDYLADRGLLERAEAMPIFGNELVIAQPSDSELRIVIDPSFDFSGAFEGCLAMGEPAAVPAGFYAKQALEKLGWWEDVQPRIVGASDAVAAANLIARAQCEMGIVYSSDAQALDAVRVAARIPPGLHDPIEYSVVVVSGAAPRTSEFLKALQSEDAKRVFADFGFLPIDEHVEFN